MAQFKLLGTPNHPQPDQPITHEGVTLSLKQWASRLNRTPGGMHAHIGKVGLEEALSKPCAPFAARARKGCQRSPWRTTTR